MIRALDQMVYDMFTGLANKSLQSKEHQKRNASKLEHEVEILRSDEGFFVFHMI